jgi:hypothetical protein
MRTHAVNPANANKRPKLTRTRFTTREFTGHIDADAPWLSAATGRCNALHKLLAKQRQHMATLDALDAEYCQIVAKISAYYQPRSTRLQLRRALGDLEERGSKLTAELCQTTNSASSQGAAMRQDLEL